MTLFILLSIFMRNYVFDINFTCVGTTKNYIRSTTLSLNLQYKI
jgi:hypothetical protein